MKHGRERRFAALSIDVDSVASHLEGYGFERPADDGAAYRLAVPRALDVFKRIGVRATFFLVAEEAERYASHVRSIVRHGHEVASHSMTHRLPFTDLREEDAVLEVTQSRRLLEDISGEPVEGFRAPSWDMDADLLMHVAAAGYRYDASSYPSLLLPLLRRSIAARSAAGRVRTRSDDWRGVFGPTRPHRIGTEAGELWEVPLATTPFGRLPHYHTLRFLLPEPLFRVLGAWLRTRRGPVTYQFHAVDFLGTLEDGLDSRITRHPGMDRPLTRKLSLAAESLMPIAASRHVVPLREVVDEAERV